MPISPTAEGFRATFKRPSFSLAEIAWRWVFGATATALFFFGLSEYLQSLPVTNGELLFLRTRQPYLVAQALAHIFRGSLSRVVLSLLLAGLLLSILWMVIASIGRIATVRALTIYVHERWPASAESDETDVGHIATNSFFSLVRISFLRIAVGVAAGLSLVAASILAGFASPDSNPQPGLAFILFVPAAVLIFLVAWALNWLLSLSALFAVRDGRDAVDAIAAAVTFCRERAGAVFAVSIWTVLAHLVAFVAATTVISTILGIAPLLPWRLVVLVVSMITVFYFAIADWLYMARLAGYVCILEIPEALMKPQPPFLPHISSAPPVQTAIDRDELILSDVPGIVPQT